MLHPELAQVEDEPLAFSLLSEKQKEERRVLKIKRAIAEKQGAKARFAVEEEISDCESYAQLTEIQKTNYAKAK
jgi:hypothetical protein